jgi:hypothetical protein
MVENDIKKLPPEERIKRLKELEEKNKKEIDEAGRLIKESEGQIAEEKRIKEQMPIPQLRAVDISSLFGGEEKQLFAAKHFTSEKKDEPLESAIEKEERRLEQMNAEEKKEFFHELPTQDLYAIRQEIYAAQETGRINREMETSLYNIRREFDERREAVEEGTYKPASDVVREILGLGDSIQKRLYKR